MKFRADVLMSNIIRKINAETKEIAIGKFVIETQNIKAYNKLDLECYDIEEIKSIS